MSKYMVIAAVLLAATLSPTLAASTLSVDQMDKVTAGRGSASFTFTNTANGTTATVSGTLTQSTTATSASQSGSLSSTSE